MKTTLTLIFTLSIMTGCGPRTPIPVVHIKPQHKQIEEIKKVGKVRENMTIFSPMEGIVIKKHAQY